MELIVHIPNNNIEERQYIIDVLIGEFLGLPYKIIVSETDKYHLNFEEKEIIISDHFFNKYENGKGYLTELAIPKEVYWDKNPFTIETDIPVLFGEGHLTVQKDNIKYENDIFAASFFMLTRWEEFVLRERDEHGRFPAENSLAFKHNFLKRPIVNEYVELIWNMLIHLGYKRPRVKRSFEAQITHDVDDIYYWKGKKQNAKILLSYLLKRKSLGLFLKSAKELIKIKSGKKKDPYDTFNEIMQLSEENKLISRFYFMSGGDTKYDNRYKIDSDRIIKLIKDIEERGHVIGFHPSYNAYNNVRQWKLEKSKLHKNYSSKVTEGRQHYLRFEVPFTWRIWEENGMSQDSSLSYAKVEGFRTGSCYEYSVFDILHQKQYHLKELPLTLMEATLRDYQGLDPIEFQERAIELIKIVKKYNGKFVLLWHNSSFNVEKWKPYESVYESILRYLSQDNEGE